VHKKRKIFWLGSPTSDKYFNEVFSELMLDECIYGYMGHRKVSKQLNDGMHFIDGTLLYRIEDVDLAFSNETSGLNDPTNLYKLDSSRAEVYACMDRTSPFLKSSSYKDAYFNKLAGYLISFFEYHVSIKIIFSQSTPHMPWDILFFRVAKLFNVPTYTIMSAIPGRGVIWEGLGQSATRYLGHKKDKESVQQLLIEIEKYNAQNKQLAESFILNSHTNPIKKYLAGIPFVVSAKRLLSLIASKIPYQQRPADEQTDQCSTFASESAFNRTKYIFSLVLYELRRNSLLKYIDKNSCRSPNLDLKYIYFPLHQQPERTTLPDGDIYRDQLLAIRRVSDNSPEFLHIYVKEHPMQKAWDLRNYNFRETWYYKELKSISKVTLIHYDYDSKVLIEKASITCSITGSVLLESLLNDIPVIYFGMSYLEGCLSAIKGHEKNTKLDSKIVKLITKEKDQVRRDFRNFLLNQSWERVCGEEYYWENESVNKQICVDTLVCMIKGITEQTK
jgi:hypothetical protein